MKTPPCMSMDVHVLWSTLLFFIIRDIIVFLILYISSFFMNTVGAFFH